MRILHLSDLHIRTATSEDQQRLITAALEDIGAHHSRVPFDLVMFTGDLAYSGSSDEYELVSEHLLIPLESLLGLGRDRIFVLPGNHDVDRDQVNDLIEQGARTLLSTNDGVNDALDKPKSRQQLTERLSGWFAFYEEYYDGLPLNNVEPLARTTEISIEGKRVGVLSSTRHGEPLEGRRTGDDYYLVSGRFVGRSMLWQMLISA